MIKNILATILLFVFILSDAIAQDTATKKVEIPKRDAVSLGLGTGLDYGGAIGLKMNFQIIEHFSFFLSAGMWENRISTAGGLKLRLLPKPQATLCPYILGAYGSTEISYIDYFSGTPVFVKGISLGAGFDMFNTPNSIGYLSLGANYALVPKLVYFSIGLNINLAKTNIERYVN